MNSKKITILWLDDKRDPDKYLKKKSNTKAFLRNKKYYDENIFGKYDPKFVWVHNIREFKRYIKSHEMPYLISFDHDLTVDKEHPEKNGSDIARWFVQYCKDNKKKKPKIFVHSANDTKIPEMNNILGIKEKTNMKKLLTEAFKSSIIRNFANKYGGLKIAFAASEITDDMIVDYRVLDSLIGEKTVEYLNHDSYNASDWFVDIVSNNDEDGNVHILRLRLDADKAKDEGLDLRRLVSDDQLFKVDKDGYSRSYDKHSTIHDTDYDKTYVYGTHPFGSKYDSDDFIHHTKYLEKWKREDPEHYKKYMDSEKEKSEKFGNAITRDPDFWRHKHINKINESKLKQLVKESVLVVVSNMLEESKKKKIHIKKKNEEKFTATKKKTGKSTKELTHSKNPLTKKRAIFAQNAKKWNHKKD